VGTGLPGDNVRNYSVAYEALLKKARALGNEEAIDELTKVGPPPYEAGRGYRVQWKWANAFEGVSSFLYGTIGLALVAPGGSVQDLLGNEDGQSFSGERLVPQARALGAKAVPFDFAVPIFVFQGAEDFTTPTSLAREFVDRIKAPRKLFVPIEGGGHFAVFMKSDRFLQELEQRVRPLATAH
jgi:pimeloyl-ACP methyl ester carboxylesterase